MIAFAGSRQTSHNPKSTRWSFMVYSKLPLDISNNLPASSHRQETFVHLIRRPVQQVTTILDNQSIQCLSLHTDMARMKSLVLDLGTKSTHVLDERIRRHSVRALQNIEHQGVIAITPNSPRTPHGRQPLPSHFQPLEIIPGGSPRLGYSLLPSRRNADQAVGASSFVGSPKSITPVTA